MCSPLPDAVRKMTSLPAATFELTARGKIAPDYFADLVIFDPAKVQDNCDLSRPATTTRPVSITSWSTACVVVENDRQNDARPGQILRHTLPAGR